MKIVLKNQAIIIVENDAWRNFVLIELIVEIIMVYQNNQSVELLYIINAINMVFTIDVVLCYKTIENNDMVKPAEVKMIIY